MLGGGTNKRGGGVELGVIKGTSDLQQTDLISWIDNEMESQGEGKSQAMKWARNVCLPTQEMILRLQTYLSMDP